MFKVGRWRNEKIKVVFRLHFQASQVPCSKSRLMISLVPVDVGQPTVRLGKVPVQNGICTWENPVYEAVKFTRETKTGKLVDKFYHFIISTGSSKAGFLGEVSVNFADYVEATTPYTIALPIKSSNSGATLHVTIQNMQGADDQRELQRDDEENGETRTSLRSQLSNSQVDGNVDHNTHENQYYNTKVSPNDEGRGNFTNGNALSSTSDQSPSKNSVPRASDAVVTERLARKDSLEWSSDEDVAEFLLSSEKSFSREREQEPPKSLVEQLEREIFALKRQAEVTDIEVDSLRRQVVKETKRGQDLSNQVFKLKEERDAFRTESEKLRSAQQCNNGGLERPKEMGSVSKTSNDRSNEVDENLIRAKGFNKALRSQLRKAQDSNSELILVVRDLEEKLDKKDKELAELSSKMKSDRTLEESSDEDSETVNLLQQQIKDLQDELERQVKEKGKLEEQIGQFSQDYGISKKENNDLSLKFNQKQLELIKKEKECSYNLRKVEELESQIARLEKVINKQAEAFAESSDTINELETELNSLKDELERQEQRALEAEENLRKTKLENANAAHRLQEEFHELSDELASKFKENEELTMKAETEARESRLHVTILEKNLQKANEELELVQAQCQAEMQKLSNQLREKERELDQLIVSHKNESEDLRKSNKKAEDKCESLSNENQVLRTEVERLTEENYYFTKQLEEMKTMVDETNTALEETNKALEETNRERDDLDRKYASARIENEHSKEEFSEKELKILSSLKEKDDAMAGMQSELENLRAQQSELKNRLSELKLDNDNLRKQVTRQKETLQKKDNEIAHLEKFKNNSSKEVSALKEKVKQLKTIRPAGILPENGSKGEERKYMGKKLPSSEASSGKSLQNGASRTSGESRKEPILEKKVTDSRTSDLLTEVALLKEKNKTMEDDLKEMQDKYSEVSLKFAEVEGERQQLVMTIRNLRNGQKR